MWAYLPHSQEGSPWRRQRPHQWLAALITILPPACPLTTHTRTPAVATTLNGATVTTCYCLLIAVVCGPLCTMSSHSPQNLWPPGHHCSAGTTGTAAAMIVHLQGLLHLFDTYSNSWVSIDGSVHNVHFLPSSSMMNVSLIMMSSRCRGYHSHLSSERNWWYCFQPEPIKSCKWSLKRHTPRCIK